jgi:hypothetical protein
MKNYIVSMVVFTFLLQSCTAYKTTSALSFEDGKNYKIKQDEKWMKVKVISSNDSVLNVQKGSERFAIAKSSLTAVKKRKFSVVKTIVLVPVVVSVIAIGSYIVDPKINVPISPSSPN